MFSALIIKTLSSAFISHLTYLVQLYYLADMQSQIQHGTKPAHKQVDPEWAGFYPSTRLV